MKHCLLALTVLLAIPCWSQTTTGNAETTGPCSPAVPGDNNQFIINCRGIDKEQGKRILAILNKILVNELDPKVVMEKLDDIEKGVSAIGKQVNPNAVKITYSKDGTKRTAAPGKMMVSNEAVPIYQELVDLYDKQKWEDLIAKAQIQIKERPEWFTPYVMAAIGYDKLGNDRTAIELLEQAQQGMADNPEYDDLPKSVEVFLSKLMQAPRDKSR